MKCPYCDFKFKVLFANGDIPDIAPIVCEQCAAVGLLIDGKTRKVSHEELEALKGKSSLERYDSARDRYNYETEDGTMTRINPSESEIKDALTNVEEQVIPPTDWSARSLVDGSPITDEHKEINPATGMQKDYVVLTARRKIKRFC